MDFKRYIDVCTKNKEPDLVIKNGNIINVFSNEIIKADIAICDNIITGIGEFHSKNQIDATNKYISPGLIDAHIHIESSMISPNRFADIVAKDGTTTIIADPHEIVNVLGQEGMQYMLDITKDSDCDVLFSLPSCVPATPFENNGYEFSADDMKRFVSNERVIALGEVMDYVSILNANDNILEKISLFSNRPIDGHSPNITGQELQAYKLSGVSTDHECVTFEEAIEKLRLGFFVLIREGSAAHNLDNIVSGFLKNNIPMERCCFCSDDRHVEDIKTHGHMTNSVRKAIKLGVDPIQALKLCTINTANCYNLKNIGAISVGYKANLIVLSDINEMKIDCVVHNGKVLSNAKSKYETKKNNIKNSVNAIDITTNDISIEIKNNPVSVIEIIPHQIITKHSKYDIKTQDNKFVPYDDFLKIVVVERHNRKNFVSSAIIKGFGLKNAAIATTVAHDSHNIIIIGDNDNDIINAFNTIKKIGGGYTISSNNNTIGSVPLEIAGLMTNVDDEILNQKLHDLKLHAKKLGVPPHFDPFITMSFMALPVIPEIRITDKGLFDVSKFKFIDI